MSDQLFQGIERHWGDEPWGAVLDAGAGMHSLRWLSGLNTSRITGVTASQFEADRMERELSLRAQDELVLGNWTQPGLLSGQRFDVVMADYLLGAVDGHAPYFQHQLLQRLHPHVGRRLYLVGMEPVLTLPQDEGGRLIVELQQLRDACILLAGHRCYREYPLQWVLRQLPQAGFQVEDSWSLPIRFGARYLNSQLGVCRRKLPYLKDAGLASELGAAIERFAERGGALMAKVGSVQVGSDYVVAARPVGA